MKATRTALILGLFCLFFVAPGAARAQSGFVIFSQGLVASSTTTTAPGSPYDYSFVELGTGYSATTTGAFFTANAVVSTTGKAWFRIGIQGFSDGSYTYPNVTDCSYDTKQIPTGTYSSSSFLQLSHDAADDAGTNPCTLDPSLYYAVELVSLASLTSDYPPSITYFGLDTAANPDYLTGKGWVVGHYDSTMPNFVPQFAIVTNGFTINSGSGVVLQPCSLTDPTTYAGCIENALIGAFYPSSDAWSSYGQLWTRIQLKPPFGYFTQVEGQLASTSTSTAPFTLGAVSGITTYIFGPIDTGLAAVWWAIFAFWFFFHRVRHIEP